jgi:thioredoxin-like negative regulator of GroEL
MLAMRVGRDIFDYINSIKNTAVKQKIKRRMQEYIVNQNIVNGLEMVEEKIFFVIISAEWSSEGQTCVSSLAKLFANTNNTNLVAKVVDYDTNQDIVEELNVRRVPTVIVYDRQQRELGRYVQDTSRYSTVEEEIHDILKRSKKISYSEATRFQ